MIIGKDTNLQANRNQFVRENHQPTAPATQLNPMIEASRTMQHTNVMSRDEMTNKSFAMLEDRLNKGLISMEDFKKRCTELGKRNNFDKKQ